MIGKTVYLGFGSNLGDRADSVHRAVKFLNDHSLIELETLSPLFESTPVGPQEQPMYLNAVGRFRTTLSCHELFRFAVSVEQRLGRQRRGKWREREIDIDLLLYGNAAIASEELTVPHPALEQRLFVVRPLAEIAPDLTLPSGRPISEVEQELANRKDEEVTLYRLDTIREDSE